MGGVEPTVWTMIHEAVSRQDALAAVWDDWADDETGSETSARRHVFQLCVVLLISSSSLFLFLLCGCALSCRIVKLAIH